MSFAICRCIIHLGNGQIEEVDLKKVVNFLLSENNKEEDDNEFPVSCFIFIH